MYPTFKDGDYLIVDKLSPHWNNYKRGDVVVFNPPFSPDTYFIKRIVGLPGETVIIDGNKTIIKNSEHPEGFELGEKYTSSTRDDKEVVTVDQNNYFVMGDNRQVSSDSRNWGELPRTDISGRVIMRLFPLSSLGYMPGSVDKF